MKYFTLELLDKSCNISDPEYEIADKLWRENLIKYWSQFKNYENRLPSRFVKEYYKHAFHDYSIKSISFYRDDTKRKDCYNIELKLGFNNNTFLIKYVDVTKCSIDVNIVNYTQNNIFLYSEILPVDNIKMSHEILFVDRNIIYIEFKKIFFKKIVL